MCGGPGCGGNVWCDVCENQPLEYFEGLHSREMGL